MIPHTSTHAEKPLFQFVFFFHINHTPVHRILTCETVVNSRWNGFIQIHKHERVKSVQKESLVNAGGRPTRLLHHFISFILSLDGTFIIQSKWHKGSSLSISRSTMKHMTLVHRNSTHPMKRIRWKRGTNMKLKNCVVGHKMEPYKYVVKNLAWIERIDRNDRRGVLHRGVYSSITFY